MIGRKSIFVFASHIFLQFITGIIYLFAINRFLPINFGYEKIGLSLIGIFSMISTLGFKYPHVKLMSDKNINQNDAFTTFLIVRIFLIFCSTLIILTIFIFQLKKATIPSNREIKLIVLIIYVAGLFRMLNSHFELSFRARMEVVKTEIPIMIGSIVRLIVSLISIFSLNNFYLYLFGNVLLEFTKFLLYAVFGRIFTLTNFDYKLFKKYFYLNLFFVLPLIFETLTQNLGTFFFLKYYDEKLLGVYSVFTSFFVMIRILEQSFSYLLIPSFSKLILEEKISDIKRSINSFEKYTTFLNGIIIIGGIIGAKYFITIFMGEYYYTNGIIFFYLSLFYLFKLPLFDPYSDFLIASENMKVFLLFPLMNFVFSLLSWIFFIPKYNILAIEFGVWTVLIPSSILIRLYCQKKYDFGKMEKSQILHQFILILLIILSLYSTKLGLNIIYSIISIFIVLIIYILTLFLLKIFTNNDLIFIKNTLNLKKMIEYIKLEFIQDNKENN